MTASSDGYLRMIPLLMALAGWGFNLGSISSSVHDLKQNAVTADVAARIAERESAEAVSAIERVNRQQFEELLRRLDSIEGRLK